MLYVFFWVIPQRLNFICQSFRTLCLFHLRRRVGVEFYTYPPMKMEQTECSETSAYKIQTPGNYPEENIQHTEHGENLKSRIYLYSWSLHPEDRHKWPKRVGNQHEIQLHPYDQRAFVGTVIYFMHLINAWNMQRIKLINKELLHDL